MYIMETSVQSNVEEKPKLVRPRTALHRYKEDGTYDRKPLSKTCFTDYYAAHKQTVTCEHCNMSSSQKRTLETRKKKQHVSYTNRT